MVVCNGIINNYILYVCIYTEQNVDGDTLQMVSEQGSYDQLKVCGLKTVADQMKLRKLITKDSRSTVSMCKSEATTLGEFPGRKFIKPELNELSSEDIKVYIMKYVSTRNYSYVAITS